jgi:serine protease AprX
MPNDPGTPPGQPAKEEQKLVTYIISPPVRVEMNRVGPEGRVSVIISPAEDKQNPENGITTSIKAIKEHLGTGPGENVRDSDFYVFANLRPKQIEELAARPEVWQIWLDHETKAHLLCSVETIKASACWRTFEARGEGITWAVLDSGINSDHPHFKDSDTVDLTLSKNFSASTTLDDRYGHGTHVAGIIAGCRKTDPDPNRSYRVATYFEDPAVPKIDEMKAAPSGIAPKAKLANVKVLNDDGSGAASAAILGLQYIRRMNQNSRTIRIDGANLSLGYPFDPKWYGCGHSPLCEEVRRAVNSGIVVVVSAGNSGYGTIKIEDGQEAPVYLELSINDPGNTEKAITVGSVHKSNPHTYGISYFSSKGPTGDGRMKPDLVAPGEKIISCSKNWNAQDPGQQYDYEEKSGTSMSAPHVSGAIAAFLSVHQEFRGDPDAIKDIFLKSATDLRRGQSFQGAGLVDLLRALSSV